MCFRRPRTTQEIRANDALKHDHEIVDILGHTLRVRPKRVNLPTDRDDLQHSTKYNDNSWKRHRDCQYRIVNL